MSELNLWWQVRPVCSFPVLSLKRLSSCAAIVSLIVSIFFFSLFASASHLEMLLLSCSLVPRAFSTFKGKALGTRLVVMRFGVVFLTQKSPSTSWIVTYHVFIAGFAFSDILNDWVLWLSISLCYEHFFSWHRGHCLPSLWSCHRIVTTTHSQTGNDATSDLVTPGRSRRLRRRCTIRLFRNGRLYRTQLRVTLCPRHWCWMRHST